MKKLFFILSIGFISQPLVFYGQETGKLRIIFVTNDQKPSSNDSLQLTIIKKDKVIERNRYQIPTNGEKVVADISLNAGMYTLILEKLISESILFPEVRIRKGVMNYLPIDVLDLENSVIYRFNDIVIMDSDKSWQLYTRKYPPISE